MPDLIRRYGDDREDKRHEWDGDTWPIESDGLKWRVTKVTAGDATQPAAIVLEATQE